MRRTAIVAAMLVTATVASPANSAQAIVGGRDATQAYPFVASLQIDGVQLCGGSLVATRWIVTAAHCIQAAHQIPGRLSVRVGSAERTSGGTLTGVTDMIVHPKYGPATSSQGPTVTNDIGLIELDTPVAAEPIAIARHASPVGARVTTMGWGCAHDHTPQTPCDPLTYPTRLQELDTRIVANPACTDLIAVRELCTRSYDGQACGGDSGGPLVRRVEGVWQLVGVTSRPGTPTPTPCPTSVVIYTNTVTFQDWIRRTISG